MSYQFQISRHDDGRRIDAVLRGMWPGVPLGGMMKHFRKGEVRLEGKRAEPNARVCEGQFV